MTLKPIFRVIGEKRRKKIVEMGNLADNREEVKHESMFTRKF